MLTSKTDNLGLESVYFLIWINKIRLLMSLDTNGISRHS